MLARMWAAGGRPLRAVLGVVVVGLAISGVAYAEAVPGSSAQINGCVNLITGGLRVIDPAAGGACNTRRGVLQERAISWNVVGPQGPVGPAGAPAPAIVNVADLNGVACTTPSGAAGVISIKEAADGTVSMVCLAAGATPLPTSSPAPTPTVPLPTSTPTIPPSPTSTPTPIPTPTIPLPSPSVPQVQLLSITANPQVTVGFNQVVATVTLSGPAPRDTDVALTSGDPSSLELSPVVTVLTGQTTAQVVGDAIALSGPVGVTVTATLNGTTKTTIVFVNHA